MVSRKDQSPEFLAETQLASHRRHVSVHKRLSNLGHSRLQSESFLDAMTALPVTNLLTVVGRCDELIYFFPLVRILA